MHNFNPILPKNFQAAKLRLIHPTMVPYLDTAIASMSIVECTHPSLKGTMAVDKHWRCYYDPEAIQKWTATQICTVLIHEVWHLLRLHFDRMPFSLPPQITEELKKKNITLTPLQFKELNLRLWNFATDAEINDSMLDTHKFEFPFQPITSQTFNFPANKSAEYYYSNLNIPITLIEDSANSSNEGSTNGSEISISIGGDGELSSNSKTLNGPESSAADGQKRDFELPEDSGQAPGLSKIEQDLIARDVAKKILNSSKTIGNTPAGLIRWAECTLDAVVNWRAILRSSVRQSLNRTSGLTDFTYIKPNRRESLYRPLILPGRCAYKPSVIICVDTSGSMSDTNLNQSLAEIQSIIKNLDSESVKYFSCDAATSKVQSACNVKDVKLFGGGGTDMIQAMNKLAEEKCDVAVLITDGYTDYPATSPFSSKTSVVTVIVTPDGHAPSFGKVVYTSEKEIA